MRRFSFISFLFLACSLDPVILDSDSGDYYAFCTLSPAVQGQRVLVGRTVPEALPETDEEVRITLSGAGRVSAFSRTNQAGVYLEMPPFVPIIGDSQYKLRVEFEGGHLITATTRVPGDFAILAPQPGDTLICRYSPRESPTWKADLPLVEWQSSSGAFFYQAVTDSQDPCDGGFLVYTNYTRIYLPHFGYITTCFPKQPEYCTPMVLSVMAVDSSNLFRPNSRSIIVADSLDYDPDLVRDVDGLSDKTLEEKMNCIGGKGIFNAVNFSRCEFVLNLIIEEQE